ncbi:cysteine hydrolase [Streptomyces adustus]|uniref:Cysteine hydrolase n=1 Tax=Streptomyces adustus TaxID=1609272 RepID=A0A5N8VHY6_9ACTN|nr:isochorismatase family cysteine hydrolase [Streptomyces adustus]MPY34840.1 cysteine hydrolase [Streptomyces adustus]
MTETYDPGRTAVLLIDPYNDFLSEGGKVWPRLEPVADEVGLLDHLRSVIASARATGVRVVFVPHRRWEPGDYETWDHPTPSQRKIQRSHHFARGSWGGEFHPDLRPRAGETVVQEHWGSSGFANTDLDMQLKQHGITHVVLVGVLANTCVEATARFAMELGYHVTLVRDATAALGPEMMRAAHELNGPTFAQAIVTTDRLLAAFDGSRT